VQKHAHRSIKRKPRRISRELAMWAHGVEAKAKGAAPDT
jgi:hypothetical protein